MMDRYVTITGFKHYYGAKPFAVGNLIRCSQEPDNPYDSEGSDTVYLLSARWDILPTALTRWLAAP